MKRAVLTLAAATVAMGLMAAAALRAEDAAGGGAKWTDNYKAAVAQAKKEKKLLLLDFTGSDWCEFCIQLHANVFSKPAFAKWANDKFVLVELDYPQKKVLADDVKKQNEDLKKKYAIEGYPTVIILDADEKELDQVVGYDGVAADAWMKARDAGIAKGQGGK